MPAIEEERVIKTGHYDSIMVEEYNDKYYLRAIQNGKDDTYYMKWVFLSRWVNGENVPDKRQLPMGCFLGETKADAIINLDKAISFLKNEADSW